MKGIFRAIHVVWLIVFLLLPLQAAAQITAGASAGLSLATLGGDDASDALDHRTGFNAGAFLDFPLGDILGVTTGLYYVQKGASENDFTIEIDYLEVPVLLRVTAIGEDAMRLNLLLGPTLAFEVKCQSDVDRDCEDEGFPTKSFDLGAGFGVGIDFPLSPTMSVVGSALYDLGLTSIADSPDDVDVKNEAILLNVGLAWRLGG